ncbi:hypothetical protein B0T17DRAFT_546130 [Bombardia bombarda]|uniref:Uncharacterized protein n=1 Tax=Bombardia bombarda TaxID=252184 RepID=A0AA39U0C2_9PEZI|nr:hypothetical protein B0T17DRAFT_546130 [Bombardia bombarda]
MPQNRNICVPSISRRLDSRHGSHRKYLIFQRHCGSCPHCDHTVRATDIWRTRCGCWYCSLRTAFDSTLRCSIIQHTRAAVIASEDDSRHYTAISYTWGVPTFSRVLACETGQIESPGHPTYQTPT